MTHLDEGTIHAWLDGALAAAEARDAESHVMSCAECSAKVAEARGLIAGASRILTALDDVPSVVPKRAPSTAPAVRQWRAAPWVTGIAAVLVLAIGLSTWRRDTTIPGAAFKPGSIRTSVVFDSSVAAAAEQRTLASEAAAAVKAPSIVATSGRRDAALGEQARRASASPQPQVQLRSAGVGAGAGTAQDLASGPVGGRALAPEAAAPRRAEQVAARDSMQAASVARMVAGAPVPAPAADVAVKDAPSTDAIAALGRARDVAGCYPITPLPLPKAVAEAAAPTAASTAAKAASADARRQAAPAAAMNRASKEMPVPPLPSPVLLDTMRTAQGYLVRSPANRVLLGFWDRVGADSVRLNLLMHGIHTIATSKRANCP